jgi:hypothetical protein
MRAKGLEWPQLVLNLELLEGSILNNEQFHKQSAIVWEDKDSRVIDSNLPWQKLL